MHCVLHLSCPAPHSLADVPQQCLHEMPLLVAQSAISNERDSASKEDLGAMQLRNKEPYTVRRKWWAPGTSQYPWPQMARQLCSSVTVREQTQSSETRKVFIYYLSLKGPQNWFQVDAYTQAPFGYSKWRLENMLSGASDLLLWFWTALKSETEQGMGSACYERSAVQKSRQNIGKRTD